MVIEQSEVFLGRILDVKVGVREMHLFSIENNKTLYWEFVRSLKVISTVCSVVFSTPARIASDNSDMSKS